MSDDYIARAKRIMAEDLEEVIQGSKDASESLFKFVSKKCESPLEVLMLGALAYGLERRVSGLNQRALPAFVARSSQVTGVWVVPQFEVMGYRVDFLVVVVDEPVPGLFTRARLVVECDGHDFHEKTPEQAQRDKSRDRALLAGGLPVLRFTGREIVRDPQACVDEVAEALNAEASRQTAAALEETA